MTASVRETAPHESVVTFRLEDAEIDAAKVTAARRLAAEMKVPGFRPGKAPLKVVEAAVGAARLRREAVEDLIPPRLSDVLKDDSLVPAITPTLERMDDIEGGVEVEVRVTTWPRLEVVPEYKDRVVEVDSPELTEDDVESQLTRMREQFAVLETVDRPAVEGDFVSLDLAATNPETDEAVPEASATELLYEVGSNGLVDGIDVQLLGKLAADEVTFAGELPSGFGERAGTPVTFKVTVNEVKERVLPDLDDAWVAENTEFDSIEELRTELSRRLAGAKTAAVVRQFQSRALDDLVDQVEVILPPALVEAEAEEILHRFVHRLEDQGLTLEDYLTATGLDQGSLGSDLQAQAERELRTRLLLEAVARQEDIQVAPEEVAALGEALATRSERPQEVLEALRDPSRLMSLASDILRDKALGVIVSSAAAVDAAGRPVSLDLTTEEEIRVAEEVEGEVVEAELVQMEGPQVVEAEIVRPEES
jgi:trigger factor